MNEIINAYQINPVPVIIGVLYTIWLGSLIGSELFRRVVAWIDDSKVEGMNPVHKIVKKFFNIDTFYWYELLIINPLIFLPLLAVAIYFYWVSMWFILAGVVIYIARMGRRGQKLLASHIADKRAHK